MRERQTAQTKKLKESERERESDKSNQKIPSQSQANELKDLAAGQECLHLGRLPKTAPSGPRPARASVSKKASGRLGLPWNRPGGVWKKRRKKTAPPDFKLTRLFSGMCVCVEDPGPLVWA